MISPRTIVHIPLSQLVVSKLNVRRHGGRDVTSLARSIAGKGLIYPLLVRPGGDHDSGSSTATYEIVAGRRRFMALVKLDKSGDIPDALGGTGEGPVAPCIVLDMGDDANTLELSLIENTERAAMDPLDAYTAFAALLREGRTEAEIAHTFSVPLATVRQRLALANLVPEAHTRYRHGDIDDKVLHALTLGSKERQRAYLKLLDDPEKTEPAPWQLKQWMLGGAAIDARHALFDLKIYSAPVTTDLFNATTYLTDADEFWRLQRQAVEAQAAAFKDNGWKEVHVIGPDQPFAAYQWEPATKAQGGQVVIKLNPDGAVQIEKGLISRAEAKARQRTRAAAAAGAPAALKTGSANDSHTPAAAGSAASVGDMKLDADGNLPEMTAALRNYVDLVRHSAVCAKLIDKPKVALRALAASLIAGVRNIQITRDRRQALTPEITASVAAMSSEAHQERARHAVLAALGLDVDRGLFGAAGELAGETSDIFIKLMETTDAQVIAILALVTAESLAVGSRLVDALGETLAVDVTDHWQPDLTLLALANRRPVIAAIATEVMGAEAPRAHAQTLSGARAAIAETLKTSKTRWQPRWTRFPAGRYLDQPKPSEA